MKSPRLPKSCRKDVSTILMRDLARRINSNFVAIELKEIEGPMYSLQLKPNYNAIAKRFATKPLLSVSSR